MATHEYTILALTHRGARLEYELFSYDGSCDGESNALALADAIRSITSGAVTSAVTSGSVEPRDQPSDSAVALRQAVADLVDTPPFPIASAEQISAVTYRSPSTFGGSDAPVIVSAGGPSGTAERPAVSASAEVWTRSIARLAEAGRRLLPGCAHVVVPEPYFSRTIPPHARAPLPSAFGPAERNDPPPDSFATHGAAALAAAGRAAELLEIPLSAPAIVVCYVGEDISLAAVRAGRIVACTDRPAPLSAHEQQAASSGDQSALRSAPGDPGEDPPHARGAPGEADESANETFARLAYQIRLSVGAMAAAMGDLHALVFTGPIGHHGFALREAICADLGFLGVAVDDDRNQETGATWDVNRCPASPPGVRINPEWTAAAVMVVPTSELRRIAAEGLHALLS